MDGFPPLPGASNGRPPDISISVLAPSRLERLSNPVSEEDQQVLKRSRGEGDEVLLEAAPSKPSFRDMLTGRRPGVSLAPDITDLDVDMTEEDVQISSVDGTPVIKFSERIHGMVEDKLAKSVIVRLLGRSIGRKARISSRGKASEEAGKVVTKANVEPGRFAALSNIESEVLVGEEPIAHPVMAHLESGGGSVPSKTSGLELAAKRQVLVQKRNGDIWVSSGDPKHVLLRGSGSGISGMNSLDEVVERNSSVASLDVVVPSRVSLDPKDHVAVRVLERGNELSPKTGPSRRGSSGSGTLLKGSQRIVGGKGMERKGGLNRKKAETKVTSKVVMGEWIGNMEKELVEIEQQQTPALVIGSDPTADVDAGVQWRENTAFGKDLQH
ncbi:hypothetical protein V6N11_078823 [Hibiscus sabdariffa]|uniref:Uncharacterized protein n=1 Tax=Hibiscus sabdariffa TaxID=183260 RepID=A0ABR2RTT3_9ROSI